MGNVEIRKALWQRDDNCYNDTCIECGVKCARAYLTTTIVKVPLCLECLKQFAAEAKECVDEVQHTCDFCRHQTMDGHGDVRCALTNKFTDRGECCDKFERSK